MKLGLCEAHGDVAILLCIITQFMLLGLAEMMI